MAIGRRSYRAQRLLREAVDDRRLAQLSPSQLLAARYRVVGFVDRDAETDVLQQWVDSSPQFSVLLVSGLGGQGKTRLASHFVDHIAGTGRWQAAEIAHESSLAGAGDDVMASPYSAFGPDAKPPDGFLFLIDYADRWPATDLRGALADIIARAETKARVLLVARSTEWWRTLAHELHENGVATQTIQLMPLASTPCRRDELFQTTARRFADILKVRIPRDELTPPAGWGDEPQSVLTIHMSALASVVAARDNSQLPSNDHAISAYLIDREYAHWEKLHANGKVSSPAPVMARMAYLATLISGVTYAVGQRILQRVGIAADAERASVLLDDYLVCYPSMDGHTVLEPLRPDRLGEDFVALSIAGHPITDSAAQPWAAGIRDQLLSPGLDAGPDITRLQGRAIAMHVEAARRWEHVTRTWLAPVLRQRPELAVAAGSLALTGLIGLLGSDPAVLLAVEASIPEHPDLELDPPAAALMEYLTPHALTGAHAPITAADWNARLGRRLTGAGRRQDALPPTRTAKDIYQGLLAVDDHREVQLKLARTLVNMSYLESEFGDREAALEYTERAEGIWRRLDSGTPRDRYGLAGALDHLAVRLTEVGRHDAAVNKARESVDILRLLAGGEQGRRFYGGLARALRNFALAISNSGESPSKAVEIGAESAAIYRALAVDVPNRYLSDLAITLYLHSIWLADTEDFEQAATISGEAVTIYQKLARNNPLAYERDLVAALNNNSIRLYEAGRRLEALQAEADVMALRRRLGEAAPSAAGIAEALDDLVQLQRALNQRERVARRPLGGFVNAHV
ncbi:hypothetical protein [Verrucosispora sp. WMMD1129]|uniref:hypothetical protein n=1 Tax=Verrucosispora sp. WMMD1129 TaxID=3016093 RepID=UPI00249B9691|nr:hypothetical protein [Verrucosispora sp. WMMD1129]WFE47717.1 hypothetical protein O7624_26995 [Verrucosispora sp. WMMD1129]